MNQWGQAVKVDSQARACLNTNFIFNIGMVNPPKDDTVRIIKLLEQFCSDGDANAFYRFKNPEPTLKILLPTTLDAGYTLEKSIWWKMIGLLFSF